MELIDSGRQPAEVIMELRETQQTMREELLAVREQVTSLQEEKTELAKQLADRTDFERQRGRYARTQIEPGAVVYLEKQSVQRAGQTPVYYCPDCFEQGKTKILQINKNESRYDHYRCHHCGCSVHLTRPRSEPVDPIVQVRNRWDSFI